MKDMLDDIPDDDLRDKLRHYSENPDEDLWEKINDGISRPRIPISEQLKGYHDQPDASVWRGIERGLAAQRTVKWFETTGVLASIIALLMLLFPATHRNTSDPMYQSKVSEQLNTSDNSKNPESSEKLDAPKSEEREMSTSDLKHQTGRGQHKEKITTEKIAGDFREIGKTDSTLKTTGHKLDSIVNTLDESSASQIALATSDQKALKESEAGENSSATVNTSSGTDTAVRSVTVVAQDSLFRDVKEEELIAETPSVSEEKKKIKNKKPAGVYLLFMPTFGYNKISPVKDDDIFIESIEKISAFSTSRLGIRAEVGYEKFVTERVALNVGLVYFQRKQTIEYKFRDPESFEIKTVDTNEMIYDVELLTQTGTFEYELKNVGVSAGINYFIKGKRFTQKLGVAAELHKSISPLDPEVDTGQNYYLFGNAYYRLAYPIGKRFDAMFQPTFNYALQLDERLNAPFYVKPYGLGLNFGVYFHL